MFSAITEVIEWENYRLVQLANQQNELFSNLTGTIEFTFNDRPSSEPTMTMSIKSMEPWVDIGEFYLLRTLIADFYQFRVSKGILTNSTILQIRSTSLTLKWL